jgi:phage-related baseplate assembly protein
MLETTAIDLSRLPAPAVVEQLDYEAIYDANLAQLQLLVPDFDATVESDPAVKLLQLFSWREMLLRQDFNDRARSVMVAFANGGDLDHLGALFGVARLVISPETVDASGVTVPAVLEDDAAFRERIVLAPEGYSVAGPWGAYIFHARSADADVLAAGAQSPTPGHVVVTILSRLGDGTAAPELLATVLAYLSDESRRPLTDFVTVQSAAIVPFAIEAQLRTFAGPDSSAVVAAADASLQAHVARSRRLGRDVTRAGLVAALMVEGMQNVTLIQPAADIVLSPVEAPWCTGIQLSWAGTGE